MNKVRVLRDVVDALQRRVSDVADQLRWDATALENVVNERCGCAFALCTGNADDFLARIVTQENLRMRRQLATSFACAQDRLGGCRYSGCFNDDGAIVAVR